MRKGLMLVGVIVLTLTLVAIGLLILDEQRYRSCLEEGGIPAGQERSVDRIVDEITGDAPRLRCQRRSPF